MIASWLIVAPFLPKLTMSTDPMSAFATRNRIYRFLGYLLMTIAVAAASLMLVRIFADLVLAQVEQNASYLILPDLPSLPLPPITPSAASAETSSTLVVARRLAVAAPTPMPTPTPKPALPLRLQIPSIKLDSPVVESRLVVRQDNADGLFWEWDVPIRAVGYHGDSAAPGAGRNVVLSGHNNINGQVFRRLSQVRVGDTITVHTAVRHHRYQITEKTIVPYARNRVAADQALYEYMADFGSERLTLLSCYPFPWNYDRIVVVAEPVKMGEGDDTKQ
jgi:sortase A